MNVHDSFDVTKSSHVIFPDLSVLMSQIWMQILGTFHRFHHHFSALPGRQIDGTLQGAAEFLLDAQLLLRKLRKLKIHWWSNVAKLRTGHRAQYWWHLMALAKNAFQCISSYFITYFIMYLILLHLLHPYWYSLRIIMSSWYARPPTLQMLYNVFILFSYWFYHMYSMLSLCPRAMSMWPPICPMPTPCGSTSRIPRPWWTTFCASSGVPPRYSRSSTNCSRSSPAHRRPHQPHRPRHLHCFRLPLWPRGSTSGISRGWVASAWNWNREISRVEPQKLQRLWFVSGVFSLFPYVPELETSWDLRLDRENKDI